MSFWKKKFESDDLDGSENVKSTRFLLTPAYGITDQVDAFLRLGIVDSDFDIEGIDIETDMALAYGGGVKFTFLEEKQFRIGALIQLLMWSGEDEVYGYDIEIDSLEIDIAVGTNYAINDQFSCYGGLMLGKAEAELDASGLGSLDAEEDNLIGLFGGAIYNVTDTVGVGMELRLITETTFTFMANFSF